MAKAIRRVPGRPKRGEYKSTCIVRIRSDLFGMLRAVAKHDRYQSDADAIDAILRDVIVNRFNQLKRKIVSKTPAIS